MKKLYTLALSALVLAASASAAAPTARIAKAKFTETVSERIEPNKRLVKVSPQRTLAAKADIKRSRTLQDAMSVDFDFVNKQYGIENLRGGEDFFKSAEVDSAGVHIKFENASGSGYRFWNDGLRLYKGSNTMTITAQGYGISSVVLNTTAELGTVTVNSGEEQTVNAGQNVYDLGNAVEAVFAFTVTANKAVTTMTVVLNNEAPEPEAETWTQLEGKGVYAPSVLPAMYNQTAVPVEVDVYESNQHKGVYKFVGVWPEFGENLELVIDASDPDYVVVPEQNTGFVDEKDGITYIASLSALFDRAELEAEYPEVVITMKDGYINIQADALLLRWPEAPADSEYETDPEEWYGIETCPDGYALLPGGTMPDPNEGWKSVGDATLMDGWVIPAFGDQTDPSMWYTVELQQNEANENLYRLVAPYHSEGFPGLELNECATPGYIQFDVTDPDHVVFAANVAAGFSVAEIELSNIYCTNVLGSLSAMFGIDPQSIVTIIGSDIPYTTFKDGVVSLDVFHGVDEESGEEFTTYDATFGVTPNNAVSAWYDEEDNPSDMTTRIWFPGVTPSYEQGGIVEITAETGAETVYNLRGQRVGKVMNPGIYIVNNRKVVVK